MTNPKRIKKLTPEQEALFPDLCDEWLAHGLSTEPADRATAEEGIREAYVAAGLEPPRFIIWLGSPWAGAVGQAIAPHVIARLGGAQVANQVYDQVLDQVHDQVYDQVLDQVYDQVLDQVHDQVYDQVYDQVANQVNTQVNTQVHAQVANQVANQVLDQVHDQVSDQVYSQVVNQVNTQVNTQVTNQVHTQVHDQVSDQVYSQVHSQVVNQVNTQVANQVHDQRALRDWWRGRILGQHWASYYSYCAAMEAIGVTGLESTHSAQKVAKSAGWWWCYRGFAIVTERPSILNRDAQGRLHCEDGPAMLYLDGWGIWAWHGVKVPRELIEGKWSMNDILREPNAEIRRCAIERIGWPQFVIAAGLKQIGKVQADPGNPGHTLALYAVPERIYSEPIRVLICTNGTVERDGTRRMFGLTVPATISTPIAAAAWGYDLDPATYAQLARRS